MLTGYAKTGRAEDINRTFDRFDELKIALLNKNVLDVIFNLYVNGHQGEIDKVAQRLNKSSEFPTALKSIARKAVLRRVDGVVHKLLTIFDDTDRTILAKFYVEALRDAPTEQIDKAVEILDIELLVHPSIFETGLQSNSIQLIRFILNGMKTNSMLLERKHFWKWIELESANGADAVLNVVQLMKKDFNVEPDVYTIRDFILPCMNAAADPYIAFARLRIAELNTFKIARSVLERCLIDKNIRAAYEIANDFKSYAFNVENLQNSLVEAFVATGDELHFAKIIKVLQFSLANHRDIIRGNATIYQINSIGNVLRATITRIETNPQKIESLLHAFDAAGVAISWECKSGIEAKFDSVLNRKAVELLNNLTFRRRKTLPFDVEKNARHKLYMLSSEELEKRINIEDEKGRDTTWLKKNLFDAYVREKNIAKVNELAKICDIGKREHSKVIDMHLELGVTDQALNYLNEVRNTVPDFKLLRYQAARLACAMFDMGSEWREIIHMFIDNKQTEPVKENLNELNKLLRKVTDTGNAARLNELLNVLYENNFLFEDKRIAGNIVRVHLNKGLLMKALIEIDDGKKLQRLLDVIDPETALLSVVHNFIEDGKVSEARSIIKKNLSLITGEAIHQRCEYYHRNGKNTMLEGLAEATNGMGYDRREIYYYLLLHYCKENKTQEALELWHKQQSEDQIPSRFFLLTLASHLNRNGMKVPFEVPSEATSEAT